MPPFITPVKSSDLVAVVVVEAQPCLPKHLHAAGADGARVAAVRHTQQLPVADDGCAVNVVLLSQLRQAVGWQGVAVGG